jgi:exoribonuclease R
MIVGVVHFYSKIKYGYNKRNTPIYLFTPYDRNLSTYKVASTESDKTHNQIAVVDTRSVTIIRLLGRVGDSKAEGLAMYLHYSPYAVYTSRNIHGLMSSVQPSETVTRTDISHLLTINVDPEGTKDIDDVISFDLPNVYITIADVAWYIQPDSEIDLHARKVGQTLYYPEMAPHTMFPLQFQQMATLSVGSVRNGVTLKYNMKTKKSTFMLTTIINKRQHTYEDIYTELYSTNLKALSREFGMPSDDSHKWIEQMMILYNTEAGKMLKKAGMGILRKHNEPDFEKLERYKMIGLENLAFSSAEYCLAEEEHTRHFGLESDHYAHASSPIRRYADLVNQRIMKIIMKGSKEKYYVRENSTMEIS